MKRGELWIANLDPTQGSEQAGMRPVVIFQENRISKFTTTVITIPLTTNIKRALLPSCLLIPKQQGGLSKDSVALCHQIRVLDKTRLSHKIGKLSNEIIIELEHIILFTLGYTSAN